MFVSRIFLHIDSTAKFNLYFTWRVGPSDQWLGLGVFQTRPNEQIFGPSYTQLFWPTYCFGLKWSRGMFRKSKYKYHHSKRAPPIPPPSPSIWVLKKPQVPQSYYSQTCEPLYPSTQICACFIWHNYCNKTICFGNFFCKTAIDLIWEYKLFIFKRISNLKSDI